MAEFLPIFDSDTFGDHEIASAKKSPRKRLPGYKTADYHLKKMDILPRLSYTPGITGMPIMEPIEVTDLPDKMITFSKSLSTNDFNQIVMFYEGDRAFARIMHNPQKYAEMLKPFRYVVSPDFSQHLDMPQCLCLQNSFWNHAFGAYWQTMGINVIPNVAWSRPSSYAYAFDGIPMNSVIAINCTAIKGNPISKYFWMKGYEAALEALNPSLILRYGDIMEGEDISRSIYFENENLKHLRDGSKR